jgi:hypothetical protein
MYFHELETIHVLYEKPILVEGSNLQKWYQRVASEPELATLKRELDKTLAAFKAGK